MFSLATFAQTGAAQGFMLALAILSLRYGNSRANRVLALFIAVQSLRLLVISSNYTAEASRYAPFYPLLHLSYSFGPLLYFYVRLLVEPTYRLTASSLWHLSPILLATLLFIPGGPILSEEIMLNRSFATLPADELRLITLWTLPTFVSFFVYALFSLHFLRRHSAAIQQQFSSLEQVNLRWLQLLVWFCLLTAALSFGGELLRAVGVWELGPRVMVSVVLSVLLIYYIGILGLRQPVIFDQGERLGPSESVVDDAVPDEPAIAKVKYQNSGLDQQRIEHIWQQLNVLMAEQKPYLQAGLKLADLSRFLNTRPNYLSQVINRQAEQNFFEYISHFRLEEAKRQLQELPDKTIVEIAMDSGFNSQNVFNGQFKKKMAITPSQYRKTVKSP
ncbi:MAG: helix-turn-helix domain-containing protein [Pseudomonadales bacterium]